MDRTSKKLAFIFIASLAIFFTISCQDLVVEKRIIGKYFLISTDDSNIVNLSYQVSKGSYVTLIKPNIESFSLDGEKYILIKKKNPKISSNQSNKGKYIYYIVKVDKSSLTTYEEIENSIRGPFSFEKFKEQCDLLKMDCNNF